MINQFKEYIKSTPLPEVKKAWKKIETKFSIGVSAFEYIEYSKEAYKIYYTPPNYYNVENLILENMTSNFSGSFFLLNL